MFETEIEIDITIWKKVSDARTGSASISATIVIPSVIWRIPFDRSSCTFVALAWGTLNLRTRVIIGAKRDDADQDEEDKWTPSHLLHHPHHGSDNLSVIVIQ